MYQPKIADDHIRTLYQWAKRLEMPMTRLVNALLAHALVRLEQGVEHVHEGYVQSTCNFSLLGLMHACQRVFLALKAPVVSSYPARIAQTV